MDDEVQRIRDRIHKAADEIQDHRMKLAEHELRLNSLSADVIDLRDAMATGEHLSSVEERIKIKLDHMAQTIAPIQRGVTAVVWLIISALIVALLGLLLQPR